MSGLRVAVQCDGCKQTKVLESGFEGQPECEICFLPMVPIAVEEKK
jgi:hypothetical protein